MGNARKSGRGDVAAVLVPCVAGGAEVKLNGDGVLRPEWLSDEELIRLVAQDDAAAFGAFYERYHRRILGYALSVLGSRAEAEDACSDVFVLVAESAGTYAGTGAARAWLYAVARNRIMKVASQRGRLRLMDPAALDTIREEVEPPVGLAPPRYGIIEDPDLDNLIKCLPAAQREVVVLVYLGGLDTAEIAKLMERTPKAIERLHERAMGIFRERLEMLGRDAASFRLERSRQCVRAAPSVVRSRRLVLVGPAVGGSAFARSRLVVKPGPAEPDPF
jgi:RNA polymerase sigma-70 factor (ECF subfamily)